MNISAFFRRPCSSGFHGHDKLRPSLEPTHDFHNGGRGADLETILHVNEATKSSRKRKQSVYLGFRPSFAFVRTQYRQIRSITV